jgi:RND family efflux transporter MFP subunit
MMLISKPFQFMAALALATLFLTGCHKQETTASETAILPTARVSVMKIQNQQRWATEEVLGTVKSRLSAVIASKLNGTIQLLDVVPGQFVKKGDVLIKLDAQEVQARLDQARAVLVQAQSDIERITKLKNQNIITQQEYDAVKSREAVAEATVKEAETLMSYATLTAPFDGVITRKHVDRGDLATAGRPLLELENPQSLRLEADVPETVMGSIRMGESYAIKISTVTNEIQGKVTEIAPVADPNSRTFLVKLDLPQAEGLRSGIFGRVTLPLAQVTSLRLPASAVVVRGQMEIVFVVSNQKAHLRLIKTGKVIGNEVEIVSGLNPDESVVVDGAQTLSDGQPVQAQ